MDNEKKKEMKTRAFIMQSETAIYFFILVKFLVDHGMEDTRALRKYLLEWLSDKGFMNTVYDTNRTPNEIVKDYRKQGLRVDDRRDSNVSSRHDSYNTRMSLGRFFREAWKLVKAVTVGHS